MDREEIEKIALEEKKTFLKISRVSPIVKQVFQEVADQEFCGDFGMTLKWMQEQALEYQRVKDVLLDKELLYHILETISKNSSQVEQVEKSEPSGRKMFSDGIGMKGGIRNE